MKEKFKTDDKVVALKSISDIYTFEPYITKGITYTVDHNENGKYVNFICLKEKPGLRFHDLKFKMK